jgi:hypothetical protein
MKAYFRQQALSIGDLFNGVVLTSDDTLMIAENYDSTTVVRDLLSNLDAAQETQVLEIVQEHKIDLLKNENTLNLQTALEYPVASGNNFDISNSKIQEYLGLDGLKDTFVYPYEYFGNGQSSVIFSSALDVTAFFTAALSEFNTIQQGRFVIAADAVKAVTITTNLTDAINTILSITY